LSVKIDRSTGGRVLLVLVVRHTPTAARIAAGQPYIAANWPVLDVRFPHVVIFVCAALAIFAAQGKDGHTFRMGIGKAF
jgi:hypothetical protein